MNKQKIIEELNKYIELDSDYSKERYQYVESTKKVISVYDFIKMIENDFFALQNEADQLLESMHNYFQKNKSFISKKQELSRIKSCKSIKFRLDSTEIDLYSNRLNLHNCKPEIRIIKNKSTGTIEVLIRPKNDRRKDWYNYKLMENNEDMECIVEHLKRIEEIFAQQYYFERVYGRYYAEHKQCKMLENLIIKGELFEIYFHYYQSERKIKPILKIGHLEVDNPQTIKYYCGINKELQKALNLALENKDEILKKIPISIPNLGYEYQNIINHQRKLAEQKQIDKKVKSYVRKK